MELQRLGLVMEPEPGNPNEIEGVLNPAAMRGPDAELYLFPRLTGRGNDSRLASPAFVSMMPVMPSAPSG